MKKSNILRTLAMGAAAVAFAACNNQTFTVEGEIANATDSLLYLENVALDGIHTVDSVKLSSDGKFSFKSDATDAPEFYRLRISDQIINVAIDSTETVTVSSQYPNMASNYKIEGSEQSKIIQEIAYKQIAVQQKAFAIEKSEELSYQKSADSIKSLIDNYREELKNNYIYKHPDYSSSYFALFQAIGNQLVFNPRNSEADIRVFAAVATSWDLKYPESERGQNLHNITIEGMNNIRYVRAQQQKAVNALENAEVSNLIDITLTDNHGKEQSLKSLKGKVVMLDFHAFGLDISTQRIMQLRELYNKYHDKGFEIYQISLDADKHFWKTQTEALPWINVNDPDGAESRNIRLYNVQSIPTFFLINKNNELVKRDAQIKDIDSAIRELL